MADPEDLSGASARVLVLAAVLGVAALGAGCQARQDAVAMVGDPQKGSVLFDREACGSCHRVPGRELSQGAAGPPLTGFARRTMIAGMLPNTPDALVLWLQRPQAVVPGNAMPDMGLSRREARDIAAYLYTLD